MRFRFKREEIKLTIRTAHEHGHFYSPVVDPAELKPRRDELWPQTAPPCPGVDFNEASTEQILREWFPRWMPTFDYPERAPTNNDESRFYVQNNQYSWLDCRTLYVFLRQLQPARVIEIGSGYSSLLTADVNQRFFSGAMQFICVEPFPRAFLTQGVPGISQLVVQKVQALAPSWFDQLQAGDVLFIDSSHVCKTGSDVNHLYLNVLPRLRPGVIVHIHDIFLPHEYPPSWVLDDNRSWNEQYLVQVMLQHTQRYRVLFAGWHAFQRFPELVIKALATGKGHGFGGCSLWLEVCA